MTNFPNKIEDEIMGQISKGQLKPRSRYIFLAEKLGLGSAFVLSALLAVLFFNLALFYLKASDDLVYLSFGSKGIFAFLESFPYLLVITLILLVFAAGFIIKKSEIFYHQSFGFLALTLVGFIIVFGFFLTYTNIAEQIEQKTFEQHPVGIVFRPFFTRVRIERNQGIAGRIIETGDQLINLQTPLRIVIVDISNLETLPPQPLTQGMFILAIGHKIGDNFIATNIRVTDDDEIPMIRRSIHRLFDPLPEPPRPLEEMGN
ncbi:MAG: hypothetical protein NTX82_01110 [Candidatus Parcubacteria bacterium]|nr:hypothetical protein [Candidatus Parcubacteria bacterium]